MVAANILGEPREANYEAVPRVIYTDPQAAAVGADEGRFSATVPVSEVPKTATYTRAYAESNGFLTLLSDGERLTGAYALGPGGGRVAAAGHAGDPGPRPARRAARHHPAVPDVLGDLRRGAEGAPRRDRAGAGRDLTELTGATSRRATPQLPGQTVVVIGGSAGIGLETARRARAEGADVVLTGRNPERLEQAAAELGALSTAAFDANDSAALEALLRGPRGPRSTT